MSNLAVFDTNVFVSYFWNFWKSSKISAVKIAVRRILDNEVILVYSNAIIAEYRDVLGRAKFDFPQDEVVSFLHSITNNGLCVSPAPTPVHFTDPSDKPFYDAAVSSGAWLVTGNKRHYPDESFIVSPREYIERAGL